MELAAVEVSILLTKKWLDKVFEIIKKYDRIIKLRLVLFNVTVIFISAYVPYTGRADVQNNHFYEALLQTISLTKGNDIIIMVGVFKNHFENYSNFIVRMDDTDLAQKMRKP